MLEFEAIGPAPFCGMLLADMGAEVISVARRSSSAPRTAQVSERVALGSQRVEPVFIRPTGRAANPFDVTDLLRDG